MKKTSIILSTIAIILSIISIIITISNQNSEPVSSPTTEAVETTDAQIETTEKVEIEAEVETTEGVYMEEETEANDDFREIEISASELPFHFGYSNAVGKVKLYVPKDPNGIAYIEVEHDNEYPVILKLDEDDGISIGNIIAQKEMFSANWTFVYFDEIYSEKYTIDRDGDMLIFKDFPDDVKEISIKNRQSMPIYYGEIAGYTVSLNKIIIK